MHNLYLMLDTTISAVQEKQDMGSTSKTKGKLTSPTKRHYQAHMAKQCKRIQHLRQALNMKKTTKCRQEISIRCTKNNATRKNG